ncbi:unnamed protein product, partial [Sphagnum balticum]
AHRVQPASRAMPVPTVCRARQARQVCLATKAPQDQLDQKECQDNLEILVLQEDQVVQEKAANQATKAPQDQLGQKEHRDNLETLVLQEDRVVRAKAANQEMLARLETKEHREQPDHRVIMSARVAAYSAIAVSLTAIVTCVLFIPMLCDRIGAINERVRLDMADFRTSTGDIWAQIRAGKRAQHAGAVFVAPREKRQAVAQCRKHALLWNS